MVIKLILYIVASALLTGAVRYYSLRKQILDIPNERSSHKVPTPRGGGLAFVILFLVSIPFINIPNNVAIALFGGGSLIAVVGWVDDRMSLSASFRACMQALAALWALWWL